MNSEQISLTQIRSERILVHSVDCREIRQDKEQNSSSLSSGTVSVSHLLNLYSCLSSQSKLLKHLVNRLSKILRNSSTHVLS